MKLNDLWQKLANASTPVKAAIITGLFALVAGTCAICAALLTVTPAVIQLFQAVPKPSYQQVEFLSNEEINTKINGKQVGIFPSECWNWKYPDKSGISGTIAAPSQASVDLTFIITTNKASVLKNITLVLDNYQALQNEASVKNGFLELGKGAGGVVNFTLRNMVVMPALKRSDLSAGKAYQLNDNDSATFTTTLLFPNPGLYSFHIEIDTQPNNGKQALITSDPMTYGWIEVTDLSTLHVVDPDTQTQVSLSPGACQ